MKDLSLFYSTVHELGFDDTLTFCTFDNTSRILYACGNSQLYGINMNDCQVIFCFDLVEAKCSDATDNKLIGIEYLTEINSIFVANKQGDLMVLNLDEKQIEYVGCITDGISAFDWSPDQELLVLISRAKNMLLMSKDFNLISEKSMQTDEFGDAKFINVGWGKKETQFHGTEGKDAARKVAILTDTYFDWDDMEPRISWRTDAEFFLVHIVNETTKTRRFQVFNREGILHSTSENLASLESTITWKNSKTLITSSTHRANKHEIILYERNGLSHGGFTLPFAPKQYKVSSLQWNMDSTVLCVCLDKLAKDEHTASQSVMQLWYVNNYHWYLKYSQQLTYADRVTIASWDPENPLGLHLFLASGKYVSYLFGWVVHGCHPVSDYNGSVAVIDGSDLLITQFVDAIIPPPLCAYKITCHEPINNMVWSTRNLDLLVYTANRDLIYYTYQVEAEIDAKHLQIVSAKPFEANNNKHKYHSRKAVCQVFREGHNVQHINWIDDHQLAIVDVHERVSTLKFYKLTIDESTKPGILDASLTHEIVLDDIVLNTSFNVKTRTLTLQLVNGYIYRCTNDGPLEPWLIDGQPFKFPQLCSTFSTASFLSVGGHRDDVCIGLTDFYRIYINNREIANNCTSYYVNDKFIILTTHTNQLKFIDLGQQDTTRPIDKSEPGDCCVVEECTRRVERGSKIVHCVHSDTTCILQMPRGNLEAIHPRILVISILKELIDRVEYGAALDLMRKHRINMNLLYDHCPQLFLDNVGTFVVQVDNVVLLNLFITELGNEDTTKTLFKTMYDDAARMTTVNKQDVTNNKMHLICGELIRVLESVDANRFFLAILSCHAKTNGLDEALRKIKTMRDANESVLTSIADDGLRHLLYLVDVNQLFDIALGTYDFNIVIMVAEKSQKDPKEYLPFLNEIRKLGENYRKYRIDVYLKRYRKALASLVKCDHTHHEELIKLVNEQKLYSEALGYFKPDESIFKQISTNFASYLSNKKYYQEAGLILLRADLLKESLEAFEKSYDWKMFLSVCCKMKLTKVEFSSNAERMIAVLKDNMKFNEAALVYEEYLNDHESAIVCFINSSCWSDAIRLIYKHGRYDFIETNLLPTIKTTYDDLLNEIKTNRTKFIELKTRLVQVRKDKQEKQMKDLLENDEFIENDDMSQISSAIDGKSTTNTIRSNATSINSQYSGKSQAKSRGKRKAISLKKGSLNEDLAVIQELSDLINIVYNMQESIASINRTLVLFLMDDMCMTLQTNYAAILDIIEKSIFEIWDNLENNANKPDGFANRFTAISDDKSSITDYSKLEIKYRFPPQTAVKKTSWKMHMKDMV